MKSKKPKKRKDLLTQQSHQIELLIAENKALKQILDFKRTLLKSSEKDNLSMQQLTSKKDAEINWLKVENQRHKKNLLKQK